MNPIIDVPNDNPIQTQNNHGFPSKYLSKSGYAKTNQINNAL